MKKIILFTILAIFLNVLLSPALVLATSHQLDALKGGLNTSAVEGGIVGSDLVSADLPTRIGTAINYLFGIIGVIFLIMILIGGILWMMAGGNDEKVQRAVKFIIGGVEGVIVIFMSYALLYVILGALDYATP